LATRSFQVGADLGENLQDLACPNQQLELVQTAGAILQQRGTQRSVSIHLDRTDAMPGALALARACVCRVDSSSSLQADSNGRYCGTVIID